MNHPAFNTRACTETPKEYTPSGLQDERNDVSDTPNNDISKSWFVCTNHGYSGFYPCPTCVAPISRVVALERELAAAKEEIEKANANWQVTQGMMLASREELTALRASLAELRNVADRDAARLHWLHDCSTGQTDPEGYEWGIYRVKWENGNPVSILATFSDFSDLDAEMARELAAWKERNP